MKKGSTKEREKSQRLKPNNNATTTVNEKVQTTNSAKKKMKRSDRHGTYDIQACTQACIQA